MTKLRKCGVLLRNKGESQEQMSWYCRAGTGESQAIIEIIMDAVGSKKHKSRGKQRYAQEKGTLES